MKNNSEEKEEMKNITSSNEEQNVEIKTSKKSVIIAVLIIIVIIGAIIGMYVIKNNNSKENALASNKINENQSNERNDTLEQVKVTNDFIKIRKEQSVNSEVIGKVYENEIYTILNENKNSSYGWLEIETANGIRGFIASKNGNTSYVERLEVINNAEITTPEEKEENKTENKNPITTKPNTTRPNSDDKLSNNNQDTQKPSETIIKLDLNNWNKYYEVYEKADWSMNAFNEPTEFFGLRQYFNIKKEYYNTCVGEISVEYLINQNYCLVNYDVKNLKYNTECTDKYIDEHTQTLSTSNYEVLFSYSMGDRGKTTGSFEMYRYNFVKMTRVEGTLTCKS